jgi:hypothetical protein
MLKRTAARARPSVDRMAISWCGYQRACEPYLGPRTSTRKRRGLERNVLLTTWKPRSRENAGASDPCAVKADVPRPTANRRPRTDLTRRQRPASRPMLVPSKYQPPLSPPFQQAQGSNNDGWTLVAGEWRNRRQGTRCSPSGNGRSTSSSASMCCLQVFFFAYFYSYAYYLVCLDKTVLQVSSAGIPASDK